ncbi:hypothetical protein CRUP_023836 [Coryphaenoides rupestris]|nr:hypothetical protein CRUP_023836 [Coryphaenoides rupestris]
MFNRLATVLQELSGEEAPDGDPQDGLVPQQPASEAPGGWEGGGSEEATERLAHLEQLVVQLKELVRDKDAQLAHKDTLLQNEKETAEARFTKLKLQAKAKMVSLNKQIHELKGQEGPASPNSSFTGGPGPEVLEEELRALKTRLAEEEAGSRDLLQRLQTTQHLLQEKEVDHAEQLRVLQAVVCEKDVRFQEQIQRQEEELLRVASESQAANPDLQQTLQSSQQQCEELGEALHSRSLELELLQQEVANADHQKQILTAQFRQMDQELAESGRKMEEERQRWTLELSGAQKEVEALRSNMAELEALRSNMAELEALRSNMAELEVLRSNMAELEALRSNMAELEALRSNMAELEALRSNMAAWEREKAELDTLRSNMDAWEREKAELEILRSNMDTWEREKAELAALRSNMAELEALRSNMAELETLRSNMAELEALRSNMDTWETEKAELEALRSNMDTWETEKAELEALRSNMVSWENDKAEVSRLEAELASLREAEYWALNASQEALEEEKKRVARLESELAEVKEAELAALQASCASADSSQAEIARLQGELMAVRSGEESSTGSVATERPGELRAVEEESQRKGQILAELWQGLCSLVPEAGHEAVEERSVPRDPSLVLGRLEALGARVATLEEECQSSEENCHQLTRAVDTLQGCPPRSVATRAPSASSLPRTRDGSLGTERSSTASWPASGTREHRPCHSSAKICPFLWLSSSTALNSPGLSVATEPVLISSPLRTAMSSPCRRAISAWLLSAEAQLAWRAASSASFTSASSDSSLATLSSLPPEPPGWRHHVDLRASSSAFSVSHVSMLDLRASSSAFSVSHVSMFDLRISSSAFSLSQASMLDLRVSSSAFSLSQAAMLDLRASSSAMLDLRASSSAMLDLRASSSAMLDLKHFQLSHVGPEGFQLSHVGSEGFQLSHVGSEGFHFLLSSTELQGPPLPLFLHFSARFSQLLGQRNLFLVIGVGHLLLKEFQLQGARVQSLPQLLALLLGRLQGLGVGLAAWDSDATLSSSSSCLWICSWKRTLWRRSLLPASSSASLVFRARSSSSSTSGPGPPVKELLGLCSKARRTHL